MKSLFKKFSEKKNNFKFKKFLLNLRNKWIGIVIKSKLIYFILIVSLILFYKGDVKIKKLNNRTVPISYDSGLQYDKKNHSEPCNIPIITVEYSSVFASTNAEETDCVKFDMCTFPNDFLVEKPTNLLNNDNILNDTMLRASGNSDGTAYSIEEFNQLDIEKLKTFHGVGEVTARAIVEMRDRRGGFKSFDELLDVKGIGPAKLKKIMGGEYGKKTD